ncbi:MAG TPA: glucose 1-dehydrogenase [Acidimicrobiales bacterium]|nr:glucose 1-dehydrogenase [Acidimicrobiales bacterium]HLH69053.1 glucose 1-dehydrogenase [Candidatus Dormibacteraeota bacterium]
MGGARFAGKVAVITGAAGGMGRAAAARLLGEGARVVLVDRDVEALERAGRDLGEAMTVVADVAEESSVRAYVGRAVAVYGAIDLFFNNAGIEGRVAPLTELAAADFDRVMAVNVRGVFLGLREVMRQMRRQPSGGAIVNTASMGGLRGGLNFSPYVASKHAVVGLTRSAALEGAPHHIRVNAVAPGHIDTRMARSIAEQASPADPGRAMAERSSRIPLGRYGRPEEVAELVAWLLSDEASYVTGAIVAIDAGLTS